MAIQSWVYGDAQTAATSVFLGIFVKQMLTRRFCAQNVEMNCTMTRKHDESFMYINARNVAYTGDSVSINGLSMPSRVDYSHSPWTAMTLKLIATNPGKRAAELAESVGMETKRFKSNVRKLKELGLTESLKVGHRLSPRVMSYSSDLNPESDKRRRRGHIGLSRFDEAICWRLVLSR